MCDLFCWSNKNNILSNCISALPGIFAHKDNIFSIFLWLPCPFFKHKPDLTHSLIHAQCLLVACVRKILASIYIHSFWWSECICTLCEQRSELLAQLQKEWAPSLLLFLIQNRVSACIRTNFKSHWFEKTDHEIRFFFWYVSKSSEISSDIFFAHMMCSLQLLFVLFFAHFG